MNHLSRSIVTTPTFTEFREIGRLPNRTHATLFSGLRSCPICQKGPYLSAQVGLPTPSAIARQWRTQALPDVYLALPGPANWKAIGDKEPKWLTMHHACELRRSDAMAREIG